MATREHGLFRKLDTPAPDAAKGGCYVSYGTGPCVDTGVLIDYEGTLTLSLPTIQELAEVAGFSVDAEALENERKIAELEHENDQLKARIAELDMELDHAASLVARGQAATTAAAKARAK